MAAEKIEYKIVDKNDLDAEASLGGVRVGLINCIRDGARLKIADIQVDEGVRRRGIGNGLLRAVLRAADAAQIREIWGSITTDDLAAWPGLIDWYGRYGFIATEPDDTTIPDACRKIVRRR